MDRETKTSNLKGSAPILQLVAQTKPGCRSACGDLRTISYPFGIHTDTSECYYEGSTSFRITCDESRDPPVAYWNNSNIPVVNISLENHEMLIKLRVASDCYTSSGERISESSPERKPKLGNFSLSASKNRFFVVGCDSYAYFTGKVGHGFSTGCMSLCNSITDVTNGSCAGVGCCQTSFPSNMGVYNISLKSYYNHTHVHDFNPCGYAFVAADGYFNFSTVSLKNITQKRMPAVLDWAIGNEKCEAAKRNISSYMCKENTNCTDADDGKRYRCHCKQGYSGNPYLSGTYGCQDINECNSQNNPCNMTCINLYGSFKCSCGKGYEGDGFRNGTGCTREVRSKNTSSDTALGIKEEDENRGTICLKMSDITAKKHISLFLTSINSVFSQYMLEGVGLGAGCGLLLLLAFWALQKRKEKREREKFFKENGGHRLEELVSQHRSGFEILKLFTADELKRATDNYHESRILGQGGQGTVYKGTLMNNRVVAIKKAKQLDRSQVDDFINEVVILSQISHKNVVKLIGCCLETELPLLVYEFVTNGTLSEHLHDSDGTSTSLSTWGARLRVAAEAAGALSYLHSDVAIPIYHRDIKSANILLDENFTAKVSDFGASRVVPVDQTQLNTLVQGTFGYIDPEYFHTSQLTEKSDVYSFGVVLAELLTGMKAISFDKPEKDRNLSLFFVMAVKDDRILEIIDKRVLNEGNVDHIREVGLLACRCLKVRGEDRPSMKEIAVELEGLLRATDTHPWTNQENENLGDSEYLLGDGYMDSAGGISTMVSEDTTRSQMLSFRIADAR
ncbi:hypothetical protein SAY87_029596 [Trapa incisa]|uniref:Uncharacterized protein n=1 Tax=Trapa incisa TaxID=236973 RepID=A0AAN7K8H2_9MYRT|nr:hypothetical protein SAY87_029596 [Trapa incisa]